MNLSKQKQWRMKNKDKIRASRDKWIKNNPIKHKLMKLNSQYIFRYGITLDVKNKIIKSQNNKCAICNNKLDKPKVDHCHKTGKVRGILCHGCNIGIGGLKDSIKNLKNAIKYLKRK